MIIGFIGAGKMARALASGLVRGGVAPAKNLVYSSRTPESGRHFFDLFPNESPRWTRDNVELVRASDLIIVAIKPQQFPEVMPLLQEAGAGRLFLSLAAGLTIARISGWLHPTARVVRAMPNTPMQVGSGASVYAGGPEVSKADLGLVHRILSSAGKAWQVEEKQINAVTALSGSGPAFVFHFIDAMIRGGIALDLPEKLAQELAVQTALGSAHLAALSPLSPMELAAQVKSPKGTTLAGCAVLEKRDALNKLMTRCMKEAKKRAEELARAET